jgi:hypothetical protein
MEDHRLGSDGESKLSCQSEQAIAVKALVRLTLNFIQLRSESRQAFARFGSFRPWNTWHKDLPRPGRPIAAPHISASFSLLAPTGLLAFGAVRIAIRCHV